MEKRKGRRPQGQRQRLSPAMTVCLTVLLLAGLLLCNLVRLYSAKRPAPAEDTLSVHFIDVGQGDSIYMHSGGTDILIDAGEREAGETVVQYLQQQGYTTVVMSDVIAYVRQGTPLPEKPVMLTFDDGYYNNYLNAYPLLQKYQMRAVISIIVGETDKYSGLDENKENYSHLTWDMINEMMQSGLVEIQNHTYNLHKTGGNRRGVAQRRDESSEHYVETVGADLKKAQDRIEEMTGWRPNTFTFPFGSYSRNSQVLLEELGFTASLGVEGKPCRLSRDPACLIRIPRYTRTSAASAERLLASFDG